VVSKELLKSKSVLALYPRDLFCLKLPNIVTPLISYIDYRTLVTVYQDMVDLQTEWTARFALRLIIVHYNNP